MPIVRLCDALAHGRTFGVGSAKHLRLLKFSRKSTNGKVLVELDADMTEQWFSERIGMLNDALEKATKALGYEKREFV